MCTVVKELVTSFVVVQLAVAVKEQVDDMKENNEAVTRLQKTLEYNQVTLQKLQACQGTCCGCRSA